MRLVHRLFLGDVHAVRHGEDSHQQCVHQRAAKQLRLRLARCQIAEHHLKQCLEIVEILSGREYIARIIRNQRVFPQTGHMQSAHCHAVAADLHIRPGDLIMHHACIVHQQIPGLNDHLFIVDQILARSAADQNQLDKILVCVHHTRVRARIRPDLADIKQLGMILAGITENRLYFLFYKTLHIQARLGHVWLRSSLFPQIITA